MSSFLSSIEPSKPLFTWYSPAERTELSGATLQNWVNKTANLLVDECGLGPGSTALITLPPHWRTAVILLASWTVGLSVVTEGSADVSFGLPGTGADYGVSIHPFDVSDWVLAVRAHGDFFNSVFKGRQEVAEQAVQRGMSLGIHAGDRGLFNVDSQPDPVDWLLAPLAAHASIVACSGSVDLAKIASSERTTWPAPQTP